MNHSVPYWDMEDNSRSSWKKTSPAPDNELVELLWRNGHVVMQSQSNRKPPPSAAPEPRLDPSSSPIPDDDGPSSSWFQYPLDDDTLARDFPEFFSGIPMEDTVDADREADAYFSMPPPKFGPATQKPPPAGLGSSGVVNVLNYYPRPPPPPTEDLGSRSGAAAGGGVGESSSGRTVGSSACGSNQADMSNGATDVRGGRRAKDVRMNPVATSSGGSGCSFGRTVGQQSASNQNHKRKGRDGEDSECHSEEADYESIEANRPSRRSGSTRKSRAAEVHNLSERKRRDRINEKMKALQELIPHCNKSDKASMLDEAIQYLKSLQLQLQIMWMGSGMAPMMFPGIGMGHAPMASINNPVQLARGPLVNHSLRPIAAAGNQMPMCQSPPVLNPMNFPTQMQNAHLPDSYARYVGFPRMQLVPQAMNLYAYGSHIVQQNQTAAAVGSGGSLPTAGIPSEKVQSGQSGKRDHCGQFSLALDFISRLVD